MIREQDKNLLKDLFQKELTNPVKLIMFTQQQSPLILTVVNTCEWCEETEALLKEISELSENINVEIYDFVKEEDKSKELGIDKIPAIAIIGAEDYGIRFYGIPAGYEFTTFIEDIIDVSKGKTNLSEKAKERLKDIKKDVYIQVYVTPT